MAKSIAVETFRPSKEQRREARRKSASQSTSLVRYSSPWASAWVVRFWDEASQSYVEGGGSSRRVAAMRAAEAAVEKGWFREGEEALERVRAHVEATHPAPIVGALAPCACASCGGGVP